MCAEPTQHITQKHAASEAVQADAGGLRERRARERTNTRETWSSYAHALARDNIAMIDGVRRATWVEESVLRGGGRLQQS